MRHALYDHHKGHLRTLGVADIPDHVDIPDHEYAEHIATWRRTLPDADDDVLHTKAIGHHASKIHSKLAVPVTEAVQASGVDVVRIIKTANRLAWVAIALLVFILMATLFAPRAHGQFSKISSIAANNNDNSQQGFFTSPFTFKAGANCSFSVSGTTATFNCSGGAAGAGGSNTQVQYNSTGSLAGISSLTTDGTITTALAGADWLFADLTTPTKKFQFDASNISAVTTRTMNVPDANATFAQAIAAVSHKFITQMSAQGLFTLAQPACADISDAGVFCAGTAYSSLTGIPSTFAPSGHNILSSAHSDTTAASAVRGDGFFAIGATPTWQRLAHPSTAGGYFKWNGTDIVASTLAASGTGTPTACTNQFVTGFTLNADAAPTSTCTTDTLASAQHANQGTTTTVLHGNAAGNPAFGAVTTSDLSSTTGNGTQVATGTGSYTSGNCVKIDANGNLVDNGSACGGGGGSAIALIMFAPSTSLNAVCTWTTGTSCFIGQWTWGTVSPSNTEAPTQTHSVVAGTTALLKCDSFQALGGGNTLTITVRDGGADVTSGPSCVITNSGLGCTATGTGTIAVGDLINLKVAVSGTPTGQGLVCNLKITGAS